MLCIGITLTILFILPAALIAVCGPLALVQHLLTQKPLVPKRRE